MRDATPDPKASPSAEDPAGDGSGQEAQAPLLELRDGLPPVIDSQPALEAMVEKLRAGSGPVAIDAERASG
ncbi:MAG: ribonuclease D, partial [Nocardioidaceae bacterium]